MKIKMKKITAGRGVLLAMALSLTFVLSTLYVVPVAGRTEVAVEASRTKSSRAEETNVPSFKIDGFVENETRASLSSSSSSSLEEKKKSASKRSKSSVANDSSAPMTKMPSSTTTVEPAVAGETDDLSEGFIRKGEIFAPANAAVFEGNDEIVALGKDDNDLVDDSSLEVLKVEDPLVEFRKSDFVEKFDMSKNVHYIEPLDENGPLPSDYVPPESKITEDEFRAEFDARFNNMTEAEAMLGAGKNETSALGAWIYQGQYHSHTNWHREITGWGYALGGCSAICGPYGWRTDGRKTEIVLLTYTIIDTKTLTAIVRGCGGGIAAGAHGAAIIINTRIPVLDRVVAMVGISFEALAVTGTRAHRRRVHHRLVRVLALLKFPSLKNP